MRHGDKIPGTPFFFGEWVWAGYSINPGRHNQTGRHPVVVGRVYPRTKEDGEVYPQGRLVLSIRRTPGEFEDIGWTAHPPDYPKNAEVLGGGWYVKASEILPLGWFPKDGDEWKHRKRGEAML